MTTTISRDAGPTAGPRTDPATDAIGVDAPAFADPPTLGRRNVLAVRGGSGRARRTGLVVLRSSLAFVAFFALWELAPRLGWVDPVFLPPLSTVLATFGGLVADGTLAEQVGTSLVRAVSGFAIAVSFAIPAGVLIGWNDRAAQYLSPFLEVLRNTAALALLPVFILVLGIGETSKIAIVVYACSFPILLSTITGVRTVDPLLVRSARSLGLGRVALFTKVVLPAAVPTVFTGVRMAATASILVLIAAEMVGAKAGLGFYITYTQFNFQIPEMYAGILTIALVGVAVNTLLVTVERRLSRWRTA
ncbi:NitT/TauT family transport system permease protein [Sediminihabitans luteus]|uniref:NitT/TauT family transport system permease protein n=1 Tax=Sediminihabitans luteus TaxID=1138585 RepID=A0A2M9D0H7_9CELL|nr:ABC transporter permease [Sediminihabitans luteus]PJJ77696.1 NitT/TauT family transport system permease protein [Sediminihabitans luteus]GIJ00077.1 ABC transporter permease [Sediminihabitans luteus]